MRSEVDTRPFPDVPKTFNLAAHVLSRAARLDKPALTILHPDRDEALSYANLLHFTQTAATALLALGTPIADLPALMDRSQTTIFAASPGIYRQMLRLDFDPIPSLRHGLSAGEAMPAALRVLWQKTTRTDVHEALGMSEISTFLSGSPLPRHHDHRALLRGCVRNRRPHSAPIRRKCPCPLEAAKALPAP